MAFADKIEGHRLYLMTELSLSTKSKSKLFWSNLYKLPDELEARYLQEVLKIIQKCEKVQNQETIDALIARDLPNYIMAYSDKQDKSLAVVNQIISLIVVLVDNYYSSAIKNDSSKQIWNKFIIKFVSSVDKYTGGTFNFTNLVKKVKPILLQSSLEKLQDSQIIRLDEGICASATEQSEILPVSLVIHNKLEFYLNVKRICWFYQFSKDFKKLEILQNPTTFLKHFVQECISPQVQSDNHYIANAFTNAVFANLSLNVSGYHLFNVKNFILTKLTLIFKDLNFKEQEVSELLADNLKSLTMVDANMKRMVLEAMKCNSVGDDNSVELRAKFSETLVNVNSGFTSLEESGLIELINELPKILLTDKRQQIASNMILDMIDGFVRSKELEKLNRLLLALMNNVELVNIILFHTNMTLLNKLIDYIDFENFKIDSDEDEFQEYYSYCGVAIISIILILKVFDIDFSKIDIKDSFVISYINSFFYRLGSNLTSNAPTKNENAEEDSTIITNYNTLLSEWINSLFDESNDGLSDDLVKSLSIKQIYKLIPIVYKQAIEATNIKRIDFSVMNNGLDYLSQLFLIPVNVCLIEWMLRDPSLKMDLKYKILSELIKTSLQNVGETPSLIFKIILNICGPEIMKQCPVTEVYQIITPHVHYNNVEKTTPKEKMPISNIRESFKNIFTADTSQYIELFESFEKFLKHNKLEVVQFTIQELYTFHTRSSEENLKLFINLMVSIFIWDSIENNEDKLYWIEKLNADVDRADLTTKTTSSLPSATFSTTTTSEAKDLSFNVSIDYHYSSIFNDEVAASSMNGGGKDAADAMDDMDEFLKQDDEEDDQNEDIEMKIATSEELLKFINHVHREDCLLAYFKRVKDKTNESNLFYTTIKILNEKILEDLSSREI
ncbi:NUT1 [Candida oxycetoniae]|uniref:Mediator of RNA polymerase II transcription subunit 5 n=1 Tax=Candida oxycetoniae TaxID=497107 RepID=A0AAI9SZJ3_9ASCO|nr:NUT1 [Candida oxycetoniae]KAI3405892.2 NUT1 [Candida oxycetoniae]